MIFPLNSTALLQIVSSSRFLVIGDAGSIGQAVTKEIFKRKPLNLHVVDISENNMVEVVRDIRSCFGDIDGDFRIFALHIGSIEYNAFIKAHGKYDYVLNLSALNAKKFKLFLRKSPKLGRKERWFFCISIISATQTMGIFIRG